MKKIGNIFFIFERIRILILSTFATSVFINSSLYDLSGQDDAGTRMAKPSIFIAEDAVRKDIHLILTLRDNGKPQLTSYR